MTIRVKKKKKNMKKIYKTPEIKFVSDETELMSTTSTVDMYGSGATGPGMSRRVWDDDDEDED